MNRTRRELTVTSPSIEAFRHLTMSSSSSEKNEKDHIPEVGFTAAPHEPSNVTDETTVDAENPLSTLKPVPLSKKAPHSAKYDEQGRRILPEHVHEHEETHFMQATGLTGRQKKNTEEMRDMLLSAERLRRAHIFDTENQLQREASATKTEEADLDGGRQFAEQLTTSVFPPTQAAEGKVKLVSLPSCGEQQLSRLSTARERLSPLTAVDGRESTIGPESQKCHSNLTQKCTITALEGEQSPAIDDDLTEKLTAFLESNPCELPTAELEQEDYDFLETVFGPISSEDISRRPSQELPPSAEDSSPGQIPTPSKFASGE